MADEWKGPVPRGAEIEFATKRKGIVVAYDDVVQAYTVATGPEGKPDRLVKVPAEDVDSDADAQIRFRDATQRIRSNDE